MLRQLEEIYVPQDERALRRFQRRVDELERRARTWAQEMIDVLPKGLSLLDDEMYILGLFMAQQRRLNLEIDAESADDGPLVRLSSVLPFLADPKREAEAGRAAHRVVAARLESEVDRACLFFCQDKGIDRLSETAIDWRVAIRYLAQEVHRLAGGIDVRKEYYSSPQRFEIALVSRDLAGDIVERRGRLLAGQAPEQEPVEVPGA